LREFTERSEAPPGVVERSDATTTFVPGGTMTFVVGEDNLIATEGVIAVDTVTATTINGGIHAVYDGDNEVDGTFELTICPDE
jgi:hypothetical protein